VGRLVRGRIFVLYVAANMALCAVIFLPWALPRETVSGLAGRWLATGSKWQRAIAGVVVPVVDALYFMDRDHCAEVYRLEQAARATLYGE